VRGGLGGLGTDRGVCRFGVVVVERGDFAMGPPGKHSSPRFIRYKVSPFQWVGQGNSYQKKRGYNHGVWNKQ